MQLLLTLLLPLVVSGATIRLDERQLGESSGSTLGSLLSGTASLLLPKKKAFKIEDIPTKSTTPGAKRIKIVYGPYKIAAANSTVKLGNGRSMDNGGTAYQFMADDDFPKDITVLENKSQLVDEKFQRTDTKDGIYNHHNVFWDLSPPPTAAFTCESGKKPKSVPMSVFMAGATEITTAIFSTPNGEPKTGYHLSKDRKVVNMIDVVNYNKVDRTVYVVSEIEYVPGKPAGYLDVRQERVDPGMCGGQDGAAIHPPKGVTKFSVNSTGVIVSRDGYIINMRGHLHDGGINVRLTINGKEACNSKAEYGGEGHTSTTPDGKVWETIRLNTACQQPIKVSKGDKIFMEANYDLALHPSREQGGHGGMGGMRRRALNDGGEAAEQMAIMVTQFAYL